MKRKLVKQGGSALTVSLPSKWVAKHGFKAGDEIDVEEDGSKLVINENKEREGGEIAIDIPADIPFARRFLQIPYIRGYNMIKITFHNNETLKKIQDLVQQMLGFEMVEQGKDYCVLKNIAKGIEEEFDSMFNRHILVVISQGKELYEALLNEDYKVLENLMSMETLSNKLNVFCRRMLNVHGYKNDKMTNAMYRVTCLVEGISDKYEQICEEILNNKMKVSKEGMELIKLVNSYFELFYKLVHKFDMKDIGEVKRLEARIDKQLEITQKKLTKEAIIIGLLRAMVEDIHHATEELLFI